MTDEAQGLVLDFAGEVFQVAPGERFTIGRRGELVIDDNPYLHRDFLVISHDDGFWWVHNVGSRLPVQLTDTQGLMKAVLAPGARTPIIFDITLLVFSAGATTYEIELQTRATPYEKTAVVQASSGETTMGAIDFTESQLLSIIALAEPMLRNPGSGTELLPTSVQAAKRLGWTLTRFNRKLDNVCEKLERAGVSGLRGTVQAGAANRRTRLVDYAMSTLLITAEDLPKLTLEAQRNAAAARLGSQS